jgi:hypothetical protein
LTVSFSVVNNDGPFARMTTERPEIIVQGSDDSQNWKTYHFNYKPMGPNLPIFLHGSGWC